MWNTAAAFQIACSACYCNNTCALLCRPRVNLSHCLYNSSCFAKYCQIRVTVKFVFAGHRIGLFFVLLCLHLTLWNMSSGLFYSWINSCRNCELAVSRTPWVWDQPVINSLPIQENKKKCMWTCCISWVWFRNTNPVLGGQRQYVLVGVIVFILFNFISGGLHSFSNVSTISHY